MASNLGQVGIGRHVEGPAIAGNSSNSNGSAHTHSRKKLRFSQEELESTMRIIVQEKEQLLTEAEEFINNIRNSFYMYTSAEQERVARNADALLNGLMQETALPFFERSDDQILSTLFSQTIDEWKEKENAIVREMRRLQCLLKGEFDAIESSGQVSEQVEMENAAK